MARSTFVPNAIVLLALGFLITLVGATGNKPDYLKPGPYATNSTPDSVLVSTPTFGKTSWAVNVSFPLNAGPSPVVLMFTGYLLPFSYYNAYAERLASWGYVTLQYDTPALQKATLRDDDEVNAIPELISWIQLQNNNPSSLIYGLADLNHVAAFGHSRGGKLVGLSLARGIGGFKAAVMVDPVDMNFVTSVLQYPSAIKELTTTTNFKEALVLGAGVRGSCNPADQGWAGFWPVLTQGSWLHKINPAGHMQFLDVEGMAAWLWDRCGTGNVTHPEVIALTQGAAVTWLQKTFRPVESEASVQAYLDWVKQQSLVCFKVQPSPPSPVGSKNMTTDCGGNLTGKASQTGTTEL